MLFLTSRQELQIAYVRQRLMNYQSLAVSPEQIYDEVKRIYDFLLKSPWDLHLREQIDSLVGASESIALKVWKRSRKDKFPVERWNASLQLI